jgi:hypothetical protein
MKKTMLASFALVFMLASPTYTQTAQPPRPEDPLSSDQAREENAYTLGVQAYLWGIPLAYNYDTHQAGLKVGAVDVNNFRKYTELKTAKDRFVVTPNNVTIDAYAAFDVTNEPVVVYVPALSEPRWYIVQLGDFFDEIFHNIGGTKGQQPGIYILTAPDYRGPVPGEMTRLVPRTKMGAAAVRIFVKGDADLAKAIEAQKGFRLMPLSAYLREGLAYQPPKLEVPLPFQSEAPMELSPFDKIGHAIQVFLPVSADNDDAFVSALHQIGLSVAKGFDWRSLDEPSKRGLIRASKAAEQIVDAKWAATGETTNGWRYTTSGGRAGYDFALRAALAKNQLGAQLSDQVIYPNTAVDDKGEPLTGALNYVLHFAKDQLPPVSVFWNLAMYDHDNFFIENDFGRYSIGSTTDGLKSNPDGSLTITIQKDRPTDTSNWLPAPDGPFNLTMRLYGPAPSVLDGSYRLPAVTRIR